MYLFSNLLIRVTKILDFRRPIDLAEVFLWSKEIGVGSHWVVKNLA